MCSRQCIHLDVYGKVPIDNLHQLYYPLQAGGALEIHQTKSIPSLGGWVYDSAYCLSNFMESKSFENLRNKLKSNNNKKYDRNNNEDDWLLELGAGVGIVGLVYHHHANNLHTPSNHANVIIPIKTSETPHKNDSYSHKNPKCCCIITELSPLVPLIQFNIDQNSKCLRGDDNAFINPSRTNIEASESGTNDSDIHDSSDNDCGGDGSCELGGDKETVYAMPLCWGDDEMISQVLTRMRSKRKKTIGADKPAFFDIVVMANCIYYESSLEPLLHTVLQVTDSNSLILASYELKSKEIEKLIDRWHDLIKTHFSIFEIDSETIRKEVKDFKYFKDYVKLYYMLRK